MTHAACRIDVAPPDFVLSFLMSFGFHWWRHLPSITTVLLLLISIRVFYNGTLYYSIAFGVDLIAGTRRNLCAVHDVEAKEQLAAVSNSV